MRTRRPALFIPAAGLVLVLAACGSDSGSTTEASIGAAVTLAAGATGTTVAGGASPVADTVDLPIVSYDPNDTSDVPVYAPNDTADIPMGLSVTVGIDDDPERIETVAANSTVSMVVANPQEQDEFHLEGYALGTGVVMGAGQPETFTFVADRTGDFELTSTATGSVLLILRVA